jgi:midasin
VCVPLAEAFFSLFRRTFPSQQNNDFVARVRGLAEKRKWVPLLKACRSAVERVAKLVDSSLSDAPAPDTRPSTSDKPEAQRIPGKKNGHHLSNGDPQGSPKGAKRRRPVDPTLVEQWRTFAGELARAERQVEAAQTAFAFAFMEGALVKALREGHWLLLDEVNLAPADALERLSGVLDGERGSLCLTEKGDVETIPRHPNFRIFGAMNPATDVGKRDLPLPLRQRFTELYVDELTGRDDLRLLVAQYLGEAVPGAPVDDIVDFYLAARQEAEATLLDGANQVWACNLDRFFEMEGLVQSRENFVLLSSKLTNSEKLLCLSYCKRGRSVLF